MHTGHDRCSVGTCVYDILYMYMYVCLIVIKLCCRTRTNAAGYIYVIGNVCTWQVSLLGARGGGDIIRERFLRDPGKR